MGLRSQWRVLRTAVESEERHGRKTFCTRQSYFRFRWVTAVEERVEVVKARVNDGAANGFRQKPNLASFQWQSKAAQVWRQFWGIRAYIYHNKSINRSIKAVHKGVKWCTNRNRNHDLHVLTRLKYKQPRPILHLFGAMYPSLVDGQSVCSERQ